MWSVCDIWRCTALGSFLDHISLIEYPDSLSLQPYETREESEGVRESDRQREEKDRPQDSDICNKREKYDQDRSKDNSTLIKSISKRHVRKEEEKSTHGMPRHPTPKI
jgi:hypothetical protein